MNLILLACLLSTPDQCREEVLAVSIEETGPHVCLVTAQAMIAAWLQTRPDYGVRSWRCEPAWRREHRA